MVRWMRMDGASVSAGEPVAGDDVVNDVPVARGAGRSLLVAVHAVSPVRGPRRATARCSGPTAPAVHGRLKASVRRGRSWVSPGGLPVTRSFHLQETLPAPASRSGRRAARR